MKLRPFPKHGDTRTVVRFAWLPVELHNGARAWLENYCECQEWKVLISGDGFWLCTARYQGQPPQRPKGARVPPLWRRL